MSDSEEDELTMRIAAHDQYFCRMIDLLPAGFIFPKEDPEEGTWNKKYQKGPSKLVNQAKKLSNKKAKRAKFDPENQKDNNQLKKERSDAEKARKEDSTSEYLEPEPVESAKPTKKAAKPKAAKKTRQPAGKADEPKLNGTGEHTELDTLRQRLQAKIAAIKQERQAKPHKEERRAAKKEKRKREREESDGGAAAPSATNAETNGQMNGAPAKKARKDSDTAEDKSPATDIGNLKFSSVILDSGRGTKAGYQPGKKPTNAKNLLKNAEAKQRRMEELNQTETGKEKLKKEAWNFALGAAEGKVNKDDVALLKKTIKRREKQKKASQQTWCVLTSLLSFLSVHVYCLQNH
jgi:hypothetical protein